MTDNNNSASMQNTSAPNNEEEWKDDDFLSLENNASSENDDNQDDDMDVSDDSSTSDASSPLPPWMEHSNDARVHPLTALHNEIVAFYRLMEPSEEEVRKREQVIRLVEAFVKKNFPQAEIKVFGSQATGLFLPTSDIDLVLITNEKAEEDGTEEGRISRVMSQFASALRHDWTTDLSYLELVENTKVPLVKFTHAPTRTSVDVSFDQPNGPPAAKLMHTYMDAMPQLRPLTFVIKYFLAARALNQPYTGGVGSFMLQLMIVSFLQQRERDSVNFKRPTLYNLGALLMEFFELYGEELNFITTGLSVRHDGFYFPKGAMRKDVFWSDERPFLCAVENPLDPTMDVGKSSFRIQTVQRAFSFAHRTLLAHVSEPRVPTKSILASILPATEEMVSRRWYKRRLQPLSAKRGSSSSSKSPTTGDSPRKRQRR